MNPVKSFFFALRHPLMAASIFRQKRSGLSGFYEIRHGKRFTVFWPMSEQARADGLEALNPKVHWWGGWRIPNQYWRQVHKGLRDGYGHCMTSSATIGGQPFNITVAP